MCSIAGTDAETELSIFKAPSFHERKTGYTPHNIGGVHVKTVWVHLTEDSAAEYCLGQLEKSERSEAEKHLLFCQGCQQFVKDLEMLIDVLPLYGKSKTATNAST